MRVHTFRPWAGRRFGEKPHYDYALGKVEPVEPFPDACGDCGRHKDEHPIKHYRCETCDGKGWITESLNE